MEHLDCLIPEPPQATWRLIIDYLKFDHNFCHYIVPYFYPLGVVRLYIRKECPAAGVQPTHSLKSCS